jgi:transposase
LDESDKQQLRQWSSAFGTPQQVVLRCRIVLAAAEGESADAIAARLEINRKTAMLWRARFEREGPAGMWEVASGRGRKATYGPEKIQSIVDATLRTTGCGFRVGKARDCEIENTIARKRERTKADGKDLGQRTRQWDGARTCDILTHLRPF